MGFFQTVIFEANSAPVLSPALQNSPDDRGICSRTFVVARDNNYLSVIVEDAEKSSNSSVASAARLSTPARSASAARLSTPARAAAGSRRSLKMTISPRAKSAYRALTSSSTGFQPPVSDCRLEVATAPATRARQTGELITTSEKEQLPKPERVQLSILEREQLPLPVKGQLPPIQPSSQEAAESSSGERVEDIFLAPVDLVGTVSNLKPDVAVKKQASVTPSRRKWRSIAKSAHRSGESYNLFSPPIIVYINDLNTGLGLVWYKSGIK